VGVGGGRFGAGGLGAGTRNNYNLGIELISTTWVPCNWLNSFCGWLVVVWNGTLTVELRLDL
jgi:hypothetical protein